MTQEKTILEYPQVDKVETKFEDLGMWGEYYGVIITFKNGLKWEVRIQEHQYNHFQQAAMREEDKS